MIQGLALANFIILPIFIALIHDQHIWEKGTRRI